MNLGLWLVIAFIVIILIIAIITTILGGPK